ncbi:hypothetical protein SAMN04488516_10593 [Desulfonauticus submarinus]|uniref:CRISPR type III-associated protein domain-containing protein n=1 Tax=Desulfonauticus submarinus TaxID=206665 RepID=A0A1H0DNK5_9BACT|nr:RAMP superfamily CRISPR-associated protein [Desulfonauticus submarinus]SDN71817.1 hypothetical protein SAMN04488516_10593 [Desulfonauticus submarinus]
MSEGNNIFQIKLKALSPISITKREFGVLYETYHYIPAWTMWNSLVKLYAIKDGSIDYENAKKIFEEIRLSNFYIIEDNDILVNLQDEKRREYISSDLKNAIDVLTNTSLDKALYEREYIKPGRDFVGWIKPTRENVIKFLNELKGKIFFIGADKNTGFGKVRFMDIKTGNTSFLNGKNAKKVIDFIDHPKNNYHLFPVESNRDEFFPFIVREWDGDKGNGMKITYHAKAIGD